MTTGDSATVALEDYSPTHQTFLVDSVYDPHDHGRRQLDSEEDTLLVCSGLTWMTYWSRGQFNSSYFTVFHSILNSVRECNGLIG